MDTIVLNAEKFFFPHRKTLKVFNENYSPDLLRKITYAGIHSPSFDTAHKNLEVLGEIPVSQSHIQRLTIRIGREFDASDEESCSLWEDIPDKVKEPIHVASVSVDGGRAQIRDENSTVGVHNPRWTETKVACLQKLESKEVKVDPHPCLPRAFTQKENVENLVDGLKGHARKANDKDDQAGPDKPRQPQEKDRDRSASYGPTIVNRTAIATVDEADSFGNQVLHKTRQLQLHTAKRKAYLGDGDQKIWTIFEDYFKQDGWCPILDFVHAIEYAFEAATISTTNNTQRWAKYLEFATHIWQGRVLTVIRRLEKSIAILAVSKNKSSKVAHARLVLIRNYFKNHYTKMDYPQYRKKGLPISSCHVESLIKQFNRRVKSTEKFWNKSSLKGVLKMKATYLSDNDHSMQDFWNNRYDRQANSKRSYKKQVT